MIDYDGRSFRSAAAETSSPGSEVIGHYHQRGDLVWAEFAGGKVRRGSLTGTCDATGRLDLAYCQVLDTGEVISGRVVSTPEPLGGGRVRLREEWERFGSGASTGVSYIDEIELAGVGGQKGAG